MEVAKIINSGGHSDYDIFIEADIDMTGRVWTPIASSAVTIYCGTVDGQGHTIRGLSRQDYANNSLGFIAYARPGTVVKDLHLVGVNFSTTKAYNGGIIASIDGSRNIGDYVLIENCTVQGRISTTRIYAGGLVGHFAANIGTGVMIKDQYGNETDQELFYAPHLVVENCAVDMNLFAETNYACGIMAGDGFTKDSQIISGDFPTITCKNVFVTGNYESSGQASGFIGYTNLCTVYMENCFSTAEIVGGDDWEGSFFTRIRKSNVTVKNCYSASDLPFSGEIENIGNFTDVDGNILDGINIVNSYAAYACDKVTHKKMLTKLCSKLTTILKPIEPSADATDEEREKYYEDLALYNTLIIANINDQSYGLENVSDLDMGNNFDNIGSFTCTIVLPPKSQQEILDDIEAIIPTIFAQGSKQKELVDAFFATSNCSHESLRELVTSMYIATSATCTEQATYYKSCAICGKIMEETFSYGELASHTWTDRWSGDEINHFHVCTVCREATTDVAEHIFGEWEVVKSETFDYGGKEQRCCMVCLFEQEREIPKLECEHSYDNVWFRDSANHWQVCIKCNNATPEFEAHIFGEWEVVNAATFECVGKEKRCCTVCLFEQEREIPKLECEHSYDNIWFRDSTNHWHVCTQCGLTKEGVENHTFGNWIVEKEPSNSKPGKMARQCTACKYLEEAVMYTSSTGCKSSIVGEGVVMLFVTICAFVIRKKED